MKTSLAKVGARGTDSVTLLGATEARALKAAGMDFATQYLGSVGAPGVADILGAGLAFMPVTYADRFDGDKTVTELQAIGIPQGTTTWLDLEGIPTTTTSQALEAEISAWALRVKAAGFEPGMYVGAGSLLTSLELYRLPVVRYWKSASRILDRSGNLAEPACGWCMMQLNPSVWWGGVWVDVDVIQEDFRGRLPTWVVP